MKENLFEKKRKAKEEWIYWNRQIGGAAWSKEDKAEAQQILKNSKDAYQTLVEIEQQITNQRRRQ